MSQESTGSGVVGFLGCGVQRDANFFEAHPRHYVVLSVTREPFKVVDD
ncbi:MAG TPA: hypothetical protein VGF82_01955 [Terracidiphilus sp.]